MYAFVKLTGEIAPRVLLVTRAVPDGSLYFGPFPAVGEVGHTVRELAHAVGLRDCPGTTPMFFDDQLEVFGEGRTRPSACDPSWAPAWRRAAGERAAKFTSRT